MSWKKFFCGAVAASMIFSASTFCLAADNSANAKLAKIEIDTYGAEQTGAILDRISQLEKSYSGRNMTGNLALKRFTIRFTTTARNLAFWRKSTCWNGI